MLTLSDQNLSIFFFIKSQSLNILLYILMLSFFKAFKTADSYLIVGAGNNKLFKELCDVSTCLH